MSRKTGGCFAMDIENKAYYIETNFFNSTQFEMIKAEFEKSINNPKMITKRVIDKIGVQRIAITINEYNQKNFPTITASFASNPKIIDTAKRYLGINNLKSSNVIFQIALWRLTTDLDASISNFELSNHTNSELHADSFHSILKGFFYINDTTKDNGAHSIIPYSHMLTIPRLWVEYKNSLTKRNGSTRLESSDQKLFNEEIIFEAPGNSLIIEDTFAFHKYTQLKPGTIRDVVYFQVRANPFKLSI